MTQVLLRYLQFGHLLRVLHLVEDGSVRLTWLEVQRAVLRLKDDVRAELPVQLGKLRDGLLYTVFTLMLGTVDKRSPHHDAAIGLQRVGQHVGTVGMSASVVEGTGLSLAVGLHQETAEVRNQLVNFPSLSLPPTLHLWVQRVGGLCVAERLGRAEVHRQINPHTQGT